MDLEPWHDRCSLSAFSFPFGPVAGRGEGFVGSHRRGLEDGEQSFRQDRRRDHAADPSSLPQTDLLDRFEPSKNDSTIQALSADYDSEAIGFRNAAFSWKDENISAAETPSSSRRSFQLRIDGDLFFRRGKINLIIGPTASGRYHDMSLQS